MIRIINFSIIILALTASTLSAQQTVSVNLGGYNHSPIVQTPALGYAQVTFENDTLYVEGDFSDLRGAYWAAFIHYGAVGRTGHRMFRLQAEVGEDRHSGRFNREDNAFKLTEAHKDALRKGLLYINISSARFQHGEIRGQIPAI